MSACTRRENKKLHPPRTRISDVTRLLEAFQHGDAPAVASLYAETKEEQPYDGPFYMIFNASGGWLHYVPRARHQRKPRHRRH